jgi:hypothetical protein
LYVGYCTVRCLTVICVMSLALCYVLITRFMFSLIHFFVVLYVLLSILCIVFPHVYSCIFTIWVQVYWPLPSDGNSVAVNKYHIRSDQFRSDHKPRDGKSKLHLQWKVGRNQGCERSSTRRRTLRGLKEKKRSEKNIKGVRGKGGRFGGSLTAPVSFPSFLHLYLPFLPCLFLYPEHDSWWGSSQTSVPVC